MHFGCKLMIKLCIYPYIPNPGPFDTVRLLWAFESVHVWCNGALSICGKPSYVCVCTNDGKDVFWFGSSMSAPMYEFRLD